MPGFDGTGPRGTGPMTGGGRGYCATADQGYIPRPRMGAGYGRGGGRGWRNRYYATGLYGWQRGMNGVAEPAPEHQKRVLEGEAEMLETELRDIRDRLRSLENEEAK